VAQGTRRTIGEQGAQGHVVPRRSEKVPHRRTEAHRDDDAQRISRSLRRAQAIAPKWLHTLQYSA
jgi:hypothetical protein